MALNLSSEIVCLMCVYEGDNPEHFKAALESLKQQTKKFHLYLLVDGPINSELRKLVHIYQKQIQCSVLENKTNKGLAASLNRLIHRAIEQTDAEYFFRMDADDICSRDRVRTLYEFLQSNRDVHVVGSNSIEFEDDNFKNARLINYAQRSQSKWRLAISTIFPHVSVMFRRSFFEEFGFYDENAISNEDILLWMRAIPQGAILTVLPEPLVFVRCDFAQHNRRWNFRQLRMSTVARGRFLNNIKDKNPLHWFVFLAVSALRFTPPWLLSKLKATYYKN